MSYDSELSANQSPHKTESTHLKIGWVFVRHLATDHIAKVHRCRLSIALDHLAARSRHDVDIFTVNGKYPFRHEPHRLLPPYRVLFVVGPNAQLVLLYYLLGERMSTHNLGLLRLAPARVVRKQQGPRRRAAW